jgi:hypothetical protein
MRPPLGRTRRRLSPLALILCTILCSSCIQSNNYPVISSLKAEKDWVATSGSSKVECVASDADGDSLTYTWSATGGTFSGAGPVATWMAPDAPGTYTIMVAVTDGRGGEVTMQLTVDVRVNHPPVIERLIPKPPAVLQGKTSTIRCIASDPDGDELSYSWSATRGNISGQGSSAVWTAPNTCGNYVIMLTVADGRGGETSKELEIEVIKPG